MTWGVVAVSYAAVERYNRENPGGKHYDAEEPAAAQYSAFHRLNANFVCTEERVGRRVDIVVN